MQTKAVMSSKGQIVIPRLLRKQLGLHQSSELMINLRKDKVIELTAVQKNIQDFFGKGNHKIKNNHIINIDLEIAKAVSENDRS